jgi:hypothetical protein
MYDVTAVKRAAVFRNSFAKSIFICAELNQTGVGESEPCDMMMGVWGMEGDARMGIGSHRGRESFRDSCSGPSPL